MATDERTIELLLERIAPAGEVAARKMFGEYGIYCDGRFIGVVCDDQFHLKPTGPGMAEAPELELAPAYPGARPSMVVPAERWDDEAWLVALVQTTARNVPPPKKRKS
jgi:TfoX/Sxy family transcriptional regulator of competence genes